MTILILTIVIGFLEGLYNSDNNLRTSYQIASSLIMFIAFPKGQMANILEVQNMFEYILYYSILLFCIIGINFFFFYTSLLIGKGVKLCLFKISN